MKPKSEFSKNNSQNTSEGMKAGKRQKLAAPKAVKSKGNKGKGC